MIKDHHILIKDQTILKDQALIEGQALINHLHTINHMEAKGMTKVVTLLVEVVKIRGGIKIQVLVSGMSITTIKISLQMISGVELLTMEGINHNTVIEHLLITNLLYHKIIILVEDHHKIILMVADHHKIILMVEDHRKIILMVADHHKIILLVVDCHKIILLEEYKMLDLLQERPGVQTRDRFTHSLK